MTRIRRILYATDFSQASQRAFATAVMLAKSSRAALTLIHVIAPIAPVVPEQYLDAATWELLDKQAQQRGVQHLTRLAKRARKHGIQAAMLLLDGDPSEQIVRAARSKRADLLVLGTHGRRGFSKFILGSIAARVVASASCPVVTVRGR